MLTGVPRFVCALRTSSAGPTTLRSYRSSEEDTGCKIWEAARATSAAPIFFKPIKFEKTGAQYSDGGMAANNPIKELMNEAHRLWPQESIAYVISIGTGWVKKGPVGMKAHEVLSTAVDMATNAEKIADEFSHSPQGQELAKAKRYYRFNVEQGLQQVEMEAASEKNLESIDAWTMDYLRRAEVNAKLNECMEKMLNPSIRGM